MPAWPMYHAIALDLAQRIFRGELPEGSKLSGRSLLAGHYNVSPETIRKAIVLLKNAHVVKVSQGKEITVISAEQAGLFTQHHRNVRTVYTLKQDLEKLLQQKHEIDQRLDQLLGDIIDYSDRLQHLIPYNPVEVEVPEHSHVAGKTICELKLWQQTGATVVAIRRGKDLMISPGPLAKIRAHDVIVFVGPHDVQRKTSRFINKQGNQNQ